jgi:hypothetical protein
MVEGESKLSQLLEAHKELGKLQEQKDTELFQIEELTIQFNVKFLLAKKIEFQTTDPRRRHAR